MGHHQWTSQRIVGTRERNAGLGRVSLYLMPQWFRLTTQTYLHHDDRAECIIQPTVSTRIRAACWPLFYRTLVPVFYLIAEEQQQQQQQQQQTTRYLVLLSFPCTRQGAVYSCAGQPLYRVMRTTPATRRTQSAKTKTGRQAHRQTYKTYRQTRLVLVCVVAGCNRVAGAGPGAGAGAGAGACDEADSLFYSSPP